MEVGRGNIVLQDLLTADMPPPAVFAENTGLNVNQDIQNTDNEALQMNDVFNRIKTHFPPAKIKKIMQTDDDIGKVSQATPVIAGRSLEFFMAMLVEQSGQMARQMNTKRITADIVKRTIMENEKFDFLRENFGINEEGEDDETNSNN
ncbi:negative cofactor 2 transcription regulator complex subunit BUR6 PWA37_004910 [Arxiozyma heterogenica]|uniref:Transcription factor CBF/NF-Y/archaeal histone domain-containing protein n=1 Tax=Arxiozyma heterogenica TaxID=278026 RepID=A0AAN8A7Q2_9SACH|nr:hypothetical protein RI543_001309 [Kazachstania heterogenica]